MSRSETVRVATCHDEAEAMLIRTTLAAHGIHAVIPEGGASAGVMAAGFRTHVFVDHEDAEEAAALIAQIRDTPSEPDGIEEPDEEPDEDAGGRRPDLNIALERRTRIGALLLIGVMLQFGTAHLMTGAWKRAIGLLALEIFGLRMLWHGDRLGVVLVAAAVVLDVTGAIMRTYRRTSISERLPVAKLKGSRSRDPR